MSGTLNKEIKFHRLMNQRRVAYSLLQRLQTLLEPGSNFIRELNLLFKSQGKFGSRDRRLYRELIYTYLRYQTWLDPIRFDETAFLDAIIILANPTPEASTLYPTLSSPTANLQAPKDRHRLIGKSDNDLIELIPSWFQSHLSETLDSESAKTLFSRPPLWLRIQRGDPKAIIEQLRQASPNQANPPTAIWGVPDALLCPPGLPLSNVPAYQNGEIEIQDISSQLLLQLVHPQPEGSWLDACAGAGGKTLQLAKMIGSNGCVTAYDPRSKALDELERRSRRARLKNISLLRSKPDRGSYDGVLVDAPCSGSGTWRRHPFLMRQTREKDIFQHSEAQSSILHFYSERVAPGGILVYCTCSLSSYENKNVVKKFLETHSSFEPAPLAKNFDLEEIGNGITISPAHLDGDGLYIATFRRS
ncbi:MAG: RsmB/NOP family class I SAM-dependent RNA methyltransferase [Opitutales bacterium]|jgi:16S rRNA (cytosine967-C5)-methyltransferase|nr:RsmB/NOP family class I SAM-dependent RNA methyltransferase [Opitutales bacterium]MBT5815542.1 RsmB/NOP family class I SAM-dependent RNA methyltransferase [Opitutales bacterium]